MCTLCTVVCYKIIISTSTIASAYNQNIDSRLATIYVIFSYKIFIYQKMFIFMKFFYYENLALYGMQQ